MCCAGVKGKHDTFTHLMILMTSCCQHHAHIPVLFRHFLYLPTLTETVFPWVGPAQVVPAFSRRPSASDRRGVFHAPPGRLYIIPPPLFPVNTHWFESQHQWTLPQPPSCGTYTCSPQSWEEFELTVTLSTISSSPVIFLGDFNIHVSSSPTSGATVRIHLKSEDFSPLP